MSYIMFIYKKAIVFIWGGEMKKYTIELSDELSVIYEDIAKMNDKVRIVCLHQAVKIDMALHRGLPASNRLAATTNRAWLKRRSQRYKTCSDVER